MTDFVSPLVGEVIVDAKKAIAELQGFVTEVEGTEGRLTRMGTLGKAALGLVGIAAAGAGFEAVKMAAAFDSAMERVHTQAGASQQEVDSLKGSLLALAPAVGIGPEKLALSLYHVESAGFRGAQALAMVKAAAQGAAIGNADLEAVTQAMIATMASGIKGVHGANDAMALLNTTVGIGDMRMSQLAQAMATGLLPSARSAGLSMEDVSAALATITDNATPADEAATRLRMTFALMSAPTQKAVDALASIGLSSTQLASDMRQPNGLLVAVEDLKSHLEAAGLSAVQQNQVIEHAFGGGRTSGSILTLLEESDRLKLKYDELGTSAQRTAQFQDAWASTQRTFTQQMHELGAEVDVVAIHVGHGLIYAFEDLVTAGKDVVAAGKAVYDFLDHDKAAAGALAGLLTATLIPALVRTATAAAAVGGEAAVGGLWKLANGASAAILAINPATLSLIALGAAGMEAWQIQADFAASAKKQADQYVASLHASTDNVGSLDSAVAALNRQIDMGSQKATKISGPIFNVKDFGDVHDTMRIASTDLDELKSKRDLLMNQATAARANEIALANAYHMTTDQVQLLATAHGINLSGALTDVDKAFGNVIDSVNLSHQPAKQAAGDFAAIGAAGKTAADDLQALKAGFDLLAGNALSADEAAITFKNNIVQLDAALVKSHGSMSLTTQAGRDARQAFDTAAQSGLAWSTAVKNASPGTDAYKNVLHQATTELNAHAGANKNAAQTVANLKHAYDELPASLADVEKHAKAAGQQTGAQMISTLVASITVGKDKVGLAGEAVIDRALTEMRTEAAKTAAIGKAMVDGLVGMIAKGGGQVGMVSEHLIEQGLAAMRTTAQTHSPSRATAEIGDDFVAGFVNAVDAGTAAAAAAATTLAQSAINALAQVSKAVDPRTGSLPDLIGSYSTARGGAVDAAGPANIATAHYQELAEHAAALKTRLDALRAADYAAEQAARAHATALSNVAHEALRAAEAMPTATKAEREARAAAMEHARALQDEARTASQAASALVAADKAKESSLRASTTAAQNAATAARQTAQAAQQAAQEAASAAAQAAKDLVSAVQNEAGELTQAISGFVQTAQQGITGQIDFSALWGGQDGASRSAADFQAGLDQILKQAQQFRGDLTALAAAGASQDLITGLLGMGPQAGDAAAQQLLAAGQDAISKASDTLAQIAATGGAGAQELANAFYGQGVSAFDQFVAGLQAKFPELDTALQAIASQVDSVLGTSFGSASTASLSAHAGSLLGSGAAGAPASGGGAINVTIPITISGGVIGTAAELAQLLAEPIRTQLQQLARTGRQTVL